MSQKDDSNTQDETGGTHKIDDRRSEVKPTDNPVPSSPEPDGDAVQQGEEKLERVKPY
jgi:hypothetical protein